MRRHRNAFTLIELLIVVAIISILTSIAVPNFLNAQTRARVARVQADLAVLGTALEEYRTDYPDYPKSIYLDLGDIEVRLGIFATLPALTTPVQYLTSLPKDPFVGGNYQYFSAFVSPTGPSEFQQQYGDWILLSVGPDRSLSLNAATGQVVIYDPTNGVISSGDVIRSQRGQHGSH